MWELSGGQEVGGESTAANGKEVREDAAWTDEVELKYAERIFS